jgi:lysyl-tRNA synthetase class 2
MTGTDGESTLERLVAERREKAARLRAVGRNPYRNDFKPTHTLAEVRARYEGTRPAESAPGIQPVDGERVRLAGRVVGRRGFGKTVFAPIRDRSGDLQLFLNVDHVAEADWAEVLPELDVGDIVGAEGVLFWTKRGELSLLVERFDIVTKSLQPLPDKYHGLTDVETRYRRRYLDLAINPEVRDVFRKRTAIVAGIRRFLDARDFLEVETPMMHPIVGGAAARPFATHHNALDIDLYLRIAPELYLKRLVVGGLERVYEINRNFRNEGLSRQHNPEFTMLEFYWAYATYEDLMALTEELIAGLAEEVNGSAQVSWDGHQLDLAGSWRRITVAEATRELGGVSEAVWDDPMVAAKEAVNRGIPLFEIGRSLLEGVDPEASADLGKLVSGIADASNPFGVFAEIAAAIETDEERRVRAGHIGFLLFEATAEAQLIQPTFLTQFPLAVSPLARKSESDPVFCDRFELYCAGREIANGFSELNDPDDQRARFLAQLRARAVGADETMDYDEDYCRALELGMPSAAGEGIGIDRLVMMLTGQPSIRDVILFPQMRSQTRSEAQAEADPETA